MKIGFTVNKYFDKIVESLGPEDWTERGIDLDPDGGYFDESYNIKEGKAYNDVFPKIKALYKTNFKKVPTTFQFSSDSELDEFCDDYNLDAGAADFEDGIWRLTVLQVKNFIITGIEYTFDVYKKVGNSRSELITSDSCISLCDNYTDLNKEYLDLNYNRDKRFMYIDRHSVKINDILTEPTTTTYEDLR